MMRAFGGLAGAVLVAASVFGVDAAYGQTTPSDAPLPAPGTPSTPAAPPRPGAPPDATTEPPPVAPAPEAAPPTTDAPEVVAPPPPVGPDLLLPPPPRGWLTIEPSITISGEFNDNVFQNNEAKRHDFIGALTPGVSVQLQRPHYRLVAGYNFSAELYAREDELSNIGDRQRFFADGLYRLSPRLTLSATDRFIYDQNANAVTTSGVSSGREQAWSNTFAPALSWQATQLLALRFFGAYVAQRYDGESQDSDTYRIGVSGDYALTPRLVGTLAYEFAYLDLEADPSATAHTPRVGFTYRLTPTTTVAASGGLSVVSQRGDTEVAPAAAVTIARQFRFGSLSAAYNRSVVASSASDVVELQTFSTNLQATTLMRGLVLGVSLRYTMSESIDSGDALQTDVDAFTLNISARYQIAARMAVIAGYNFFLQRSDTPRFVDVDQNRVFVGLQYGYPINID